MCLSSKDNYQEKSFAVTNQISYVAQDVHSLSMRFREITFHRTSSPQNHSNAKKNLSPTPQDLDSYLKEATATMFHDCTFAQHVDMGYNYQHLSLIKLNHKGKLP